MNPHCGIKRNENNYIDIIICLIYKTGNYEESFKI